MCGLTGFYTAGGLNDGAPSVIERMTRSLVHRGPDDGGVWLDAEAGMALGHRRLSILDLSAAGHQPMLSASRRFVLVFNGEIYNHTDLRIELDAAEAVNWRGHSDTETLLNAFERWGVAATLQRCTGMFALALWDRQSSVLILARDRFGEKPLYYGWQGNTLLFGSELKALACHPAFADEIDRESLAMMLHGGYVPAPRSIFCGVNKLPPGCWMAFKLGRGMSSDARVTVPQAYWSLDEAIATGMRQPFTGSDNEAVDQLEILLRDAVRGQQLADVPLGAFLSGGIDSSLVVALMQTQSTRPVKTFSIGFDEAAFDEAVYARAVARHLGTEHTELYVTPADAMAVIPQMASIFDEPIADSSQIPTLLVSRMARAHVAVALSGDGGDEIFGGYNRYLLAESVWNRLVRLPAGVRRTVSRCLTGVTTETWDKMYHTLSRVVPQSQRLAHAGDKMHKLGDVMCCNSEVELYRALMQLWPHAESIVHGASSMVLTEKLPQQSPQSLGFVPWMMAMDTLNYLPGDMLAKVDRAAMSVSLETRVPLLDHRVAEFAWRLPMSMKVRDGQGKWILRQVLYRHVPRELIERPKQGFVVPVGIWLRGPLRDWAEALLDEQRLRREGFFDPQQVRKVWLAHLSGQRYQPQQLWAVLMFQSWLEARSVAPALQWMHAVA